MADSDNSKVVLGTPYIHEKSLMQDVILIYFELDSDGKKTKVLNQTQATVSLIEDIWKTLTTKDTNSVSSEITGDSKTPYSVVLKSFGSKSSSKKQWFFRVKYTSPDPDRTNSFDTFDLPVPTPKGDVFDYNYEANSSDTEWAAYWKKIMKTAEDSLSNSTNAIKPAKKEFKAIAANNYPKLIDETKPWTDDNVSFTATESERNDLVWTGTANITETVATEYVEYQKPDGTFSGEIVPKGSLEPKPIEAGMYEKENPYSNGLGGLMTSFW